jgi:hypothetical protein
MASIRKEKYKPKKIFLRLMLKMRQCGKKNKDDVKLKIITFIVFLIHHVTHIKPTQIIKESDKLFKTYSDMLNDETLSNEIHPLISNLSFLDINYKKSIVQKTTYANQLAIETNKILKLYNQSLNQNELTALFSDFIVLIFINYQTLVFDYKASKNLADKTKYEQKLECASVTLELVNRIRVILLKLLPTNMDLMMVLVNTLLEKLY